MLGAAIGDIVGSRFEFHNNRSKNFQLFTSTSTVTDDTIMTFAVAKAIMETVKAKGPVVSNDYLIYLEQMTIKYIQDIGRVYPNCGYGGMFSKWVFSIDPKPYNSYGNGAAMRISPTGFTARSEDEVIALSHTVTKATHNHPEGLKGAEATAKAIFWARQGFSKDDIRRMIQSNYYSLDFTIDGIRPTYRFNETCQDTVPQAIEAFLESSSFEDAIRTAVSVGGDSDTLAAITGSIAEAFYGIPDDIKAEALTFLDTALREIYDEWVVFMCK